ncbi:hypothetical protein GEV29_13155 [Aeromicrobium sp. SMF47]|uniref:Uncharacterized protein n=1 Tax=Aeromicrobium yanjiei TaxID=2662028 RepID=A0A5Q2MK43_9ACTN|nr:MULTISPECIES: hypothetical protein [Aeromicrobium]MRJ77489.1 hypothetical protein [Aeromicrobium yanjiei]MRK01856.1 hypothetical protein [Aeromicrobium sp. S22]QGG41402.1 hypothetical protein GEV26_08530 [Aeromicrobium yanjiei]
MSDYQSEEIEAIQFVVNRVSAYQDGAEEGFVEKELRKGFDEAEIQVAPEHVDKLAAAIYDKDGDVSAVDVLSA